MEKVSLHCLMEDSMKESIRMIRKKGKESLYGPMEESMLGVGKMGSKMDKGRYLMRKEKRQWGRGWME